MFWSVRHFCSKANSRYRIGHHVTLSLLLLMKIILKVSVILLLLLKCNSNAYCCWKTKLRYRSCCYCFWIFHLKYRMIYIILIKFCKINSSWLFHKKKKMNSIAIKTLTYKSHKQNIINKTNFKQILYHLSVYILTMYSFSYWYLIADETLEKVNLIFDLF